MYLIDALRVLLRRWRIVAAGVLALLIATGAVAEWVPRQWQANAQVLLLLRPAATGKKTPTNPYLNLQPGLATTASIVASSLSDPPTKRSISDAGYTADYSVALLPGTGPLLVVTTKSAKPQEALDTRDEVMRRLQTRLSSIQTEVNVPENQTIEPRTLISDDRAEVLPGSRFRALAGIAIAIVIVTLIIAFVRDRAIRRRRAAEARAQRATSKTTSARRPPEKDAEATGPTRRDGPRTSRSRPVRRPRATPPSGRRRTGSGDGDSAGEGEGEGAGGEPADLVGSKSAVPPGGSGAR